MRNLFERKSKPTTFVSMLAAHDALPTYATKVVSLDPTAAKYLVYQGNANGAQATSEFAER